MLGKVLNILIWNDNLDKPAIAREILNSESFKKEYGDFPAKISGTDYIEVSKLQGTSGCSAEHPYWCWSVCATVETPHGKQLIWPGCGVVLLEDNVIVVMTPAQVLNYARRLTLSR